jgi:glycosyltransferase involved in cell wall biosynthesis
LRVVLISNGLTPIYEAGFANGLAANGVDVTLFVSDRSLVNELSPDIEAVNLRGSQVVMRSARRKALNLLWYFIRVLAALAHRSATVHFIGFFMLAHIHKGWADRTWLWECRLLRLFSRRLIFTVHNVMPHERDTPKIRRLMAKIYRIPDRLVVHTLRSRQRLMDEFGVPTERIVVMEHGINELIQPDPIRIASTRAALNISNGQRLVLFFGNVQYYKGVDLLLDAARRFGPNARMHIAGRCADPTYGQEIRRMMAEHPLGDRLTWEGEDAFLSEERVSELLSAADVLVMPYRHIDQSGVLFAALRHGTPVVAFDVGSFRDYLPEGVGMVVPFGDLVALAAAVESIETGPAARERVLQVAEHYLWPEAVKPVLPEYGVII